MPLPSSVPRQELHLRRIELRGYRRVDGLYDLEAHRVDTKSEGLTVGGGRVVSPGEPVHDMSIRLVVDEDLNVMDVLACTDASPHSVCCEATSTLQFFKRSASPARLLASPSKLQRERYVQPNG